MRGQGRTPQSSPALLGQAQLETLGLLDVERLEVAEPRVGLEPVASLKPLASTK